MWWRLRAMDPAHADDVECNHKRTPANAKTASFTAARMASFSTKTREVAAVMAAQIPSGRLCAQHGLGPLMLNGRQLGWC